MFKRFALFLVTNLSVLLLLTVVLGLLGFSGILDEQRLGIDYTALLILVCAASRMVAIMKLST